MSSARVVAWRESISLRAILTFLVLFLPLAIPVLVGVPPPGAQSLAEYGAAIAADVYARAPFAVLVLGLVCAYQVVSLRIARATIAPWPLFTTVLAAALLSRVVDELPLPTSRAWEPVWHDFVHRRVGTIACTVSILLPGWVCIRHSRWVRDLIEDDDDSAPPERSRHFLIRYRLPVFMTAVAVAIAWTAIAYDVADGNGATATWLFGPMSFRLIAGGLVLLPVIAIVVVMDEHFARHGHFARAKRGGLLALTYLSLVVGLIGLALALSVPQQTFPRTHALVYGPGSASVEPSASPSAPRDATTGEVVPATARPTPIQAGSFQQHALALLCLLAWAYTFQILLLRQRFEFRRMSQFGATHVCFRLLTETLSTAIASGVLAMSGLAVALVFLIFARDWPGSADLGQRIFGDNYKTVAISVYATYLGLISTLTTAVATFHKLARHATERTLIRRVYALEGHTVVIGLDGVGSRVVRDIVANVHTTPAARAANLQRLVLPSLLEQWATVMAPWSKREAATRGRPLRVLKEPLDDAPPPIDLRRMLTLAKLIVIDPEGKGMLPVATTESGVVIAVKILEFSKNEPPVLLIGLIGDVTSKSVAGAARLVHAAEIISCVRDARVSSALFEARGADACKLIVAQEDYVERNYRMKDAVLSNAAFFVPGARKTMAMAQRLASEIAARRTNGPSNVILVTDGRDVFKLLDYLHALLRREGQPVDRLARVTVWTQSRDLLNMASPVHRFRAFPKLVRGAINVIVSGEAEPSRTWRVGLVEITNAFVADRLMADMRARGRRGRLHRPDVIAILVEDGLLARESTFEAVSWVRRARQSGVGSEYDPALVVMGSDESRQDVLLTLREFTFAPGGPKDASYPANFVDGARETADLVLGLSHRGVPASDGARPIELNFCLQDVPGGYAAVLSRLSFGHHPTFGDGGPVPNLANIAISDLGNTALMSCDARLVPGADPAAPATLPPEHLRAALVFGADEADSNGETPTGSGVGDWLRSQLATREELLPPVTDAASLEALQQNERAWQCPEIRRCPFTSAKRWLCNQTLARTGESHLLAQHLLAWKMRPHASPRSTSYGNAALEIALDDHHRSGVLAALLLGLMFEKPDVGRVLQGDHRWAFNMTAAYTYPCSDPAHVYDKIYGALVPISPAHKANYEQLQSGSLAPLRGLAVRVEDETGYEPWGAYLARLVKFWNDFHAPGLTAELESRGRSRYSLFRVRFDRSHTKLDRRFWIVLRHEEAQDAEATTALDKLAVDVGARPEPEGANGETEAADELDSNRAHRDTSTVAFISSSVRRGLARLVPVA